MWPLLRSCFGCCLNCVGLRDRIDNGSEEREREIERNHSIVRFIAVVVFVVLLLLFGQWCLFGLVGEPLKHVVVFDDEPFVDA
jgi:hypothetical protein